MVLSIINMCNISMLACVENQLVYNLSLQINVFKPGIYTVLWIKTGLVCNLIIFSS